MISVITATYNRSKILERCFESLVRQTIQNFEWIIVDDGSMDDTAETVKEFQKKCQFNIKYIKKNNGGKHTALNLAQQYVEGEIICFLDSDDYLTRDAISLIITYWKKYQSNPNIGVISFLKGYNDKTPIIGSVSSEEVESNHIQYRINNKLKGDMCETVKREVFLKQKFPEFPNENFMSEGWLWVTIAYNYNTVYVNKIIYIAEYLENGLTNQGKKLRLMSPNGGMVNSLVQMGKEINIRHRVKHAILFNVYFLSSKMNFKSYFLTKYLFIRVMTFIPAIFFYNKWRKS